MKKIEIQDIEIVADGLDHPECVIYHPNGKLYAGSESGIIYEINKEGQIKEIANSGGFILGLALNPDATWIAVCDSGKKCIWKLDLETNQLSFLLDNVQGEKLKIPNFCFFDSHGNLYLSESGDFRKTTGLIYKITENGDAKVWHSGPFNFANGVALSPQEDYLYVVSSFLPGLERIEINKDGTAGEREVVLKMPETVPDGIAFDQAGRLLISCYAPNAIYVLEKDGSLCELVNDWEAHTLCNPTNIAFGGASFDQLFVANLGRWHVSKINLDFKGQQLVCHKK